ncbi:MAG: molybdate ABC transporter substrate-binding protein [Actinobacteria bacterium]|nr:molybdate ABC transporter substrate-binding protein [Actinomycetota bacterium]
MRKKLTVGVIVIFAALTLITGTIGCGSNTKTESKTTTPEKKIDYADSIMVYSGAGMRKPMDEIGALFEKKYGTKVNYNYAGSNALLSQMEVSREGDVYMPGETYYLELADEKGFIDKQELIAYHIPVITVPQGNPASIKQLSDLANEGVKVVWGDPEAAAIGKHGNKILEKNGLKDAVWKNIIATVPTMNELIVYISEGQADASVNWGDVVQDVEKIKVIDIPKEQNIIEVIPVGSLTFSREKETADAFVDFCASDEALEIFEKNGFPAYPNPEYEVESDDKTESK